MVQNTKAAIYHQVAELHDGGHIFTGGPKNKDVKSSRNPEQRQDISGEMVKSSLLTVALVAEGAF